MPHVIILYDDQGNEIGRYSPPHEGDRTTGSVVIYDDAITAAIAAALAKKPDADAVVCKFKAKQGDT